MEQVLKLYKYIDGINDSPFPNVDEQVIIGEFEYTADRMGGAPSITATVSHTLCLDDYWDANVYAEFNGEKYFVINTPSSTKDNEDARYEHDLELLSEREILNHVYFLDAVQGDSSIDGYQSNSTEVMFYGDIVDFVERLNASMSYSGLDYTAVIDDGITSDEMLIEFDDLVILEALQEAFDNFETPYYFVGKVIHFGYTANTITTVLRYGHEDALLSVSRENANYNFFNRITGRGSEDNIPYYYPNNSPKGNIAAVAGSSNTGVTDDDIILVNGELYANNIDLDGVLEYTNYSGANYNTSAAYYGGSYASGFEEYYNSETDDGYEPATMGIYGADGITEYSFYGGFQIGTGSLTAAIRLYRNGTVIPFLTSGGDTQLTYSISLVHSNGTSTPDSTTEDNSTGTITVTFNDVPNGSANLWITYTTNRLAITSYTLLCCVFGVPSDSASVYVNGWVYNGTVYDLSDVGLKISSSTTPSVGDTITQTLLSYWPVTDALMPSIYRDTEGLERFYNAKNETYLNDENEYYEFENEYTEQNPREGIQDFDEIKPTITGMTNADGERIDSFIEFAYDEDDNDEIDTDSNEYVHPYFYAKMRKTNGDNGFNLFDSTLEGETMTISMTSGECGACEFEIGVDDDTNLNMVQVDDDGNLVRDDDGNVVHSGSAQDRQNDTENYEVWLALKKDASTYPTVMPNVTGNYKPSTDDTFVILGINLPEAYITAAEDRLEAALIEYMWENNTEKFTYSIEFSRIFFAENPDILNALNENSRIVLEYNGQEHYLYIESYTYKMEEDSPLPIVELELVDELTTSTNSLQSQLDAAKQDILYSINGSDFLLTGLKYFIRKDIADTAQGKITFRGGIAVGSSGFEEGQEGKGAEIDGSGDATFGDITIRGKMKTPSFVSGSLGEGMLLGYYGSTDTYLEIDKLFVRKNAIFTQLTIQELKYVGGNIVLTPASMKCTSVEYLDIPAYFNDDSAAYFSDGQRAYFPSVYRCYFNTENDETIVENEFVIGDLARSQTFDIKEGVYENVSNHYWWRLVVGVGEDYIDLSETTCDEGSDEPQAGDTIVQLGNVNDSARQAAIVLSAYGAEAPSITLYQNIDSFSLSGKAIQRTYYDPENKECVVLTGKEDDGNGYMRYSPSEGLTVQGKVEILGGSGIANFEDIDEITSEIASGLTDDVTEVIAQNIGYDGWTSMVESALQGNTIINGGVINTSLINVDDLFVGDIYAGNATITSGTFNEITVNDAVIDNVTITNANITGELTANTLDLKISTDEDVIDGALLLAGIGGYTIQGKFPALNSGVCRKIDFIYPLISRTIVQYTFEGENSNVLFVVLNDYASWHTITVNNIQGVALSCYGIGTDTYTYWILVPMNGDSDTVFRNATFGS